MTAAITFLTFMAAVPALGFVALYSRMPWWRSMVGRGVMILVSSLLLLIGMGVLRVFFGREYPWRDAILLGVYAVVMAGLWVMFIALLRVRRDQRPRLLNKP